MNKQTFRLKIQRVSGINNNSVLDRMVNCFIREWMGVKIGFGKKITEKILVYRSRPLRCKNELCNSVGNLFIHGVYFSGKNFCWFRNVKTSLVHEYNPDGILYKLKEEPSDLDKFIKPSKLEKEIILSCFE